MTYETIAAAYIILALCEVRVALIYRAKENVNLALAALLIATCYALISGAYIVTANVTTNHDVWLMSSTPGMYFASMSGCWPVI